MLIWTYRSKVLLQSLAIPVGELFLVLGLLGDDFDVELFFRQFDELFVEELMPLLGF